jgi:hypothetical protein
MSESVKRQRDDNTDVPVPVLTDRKKKHRTTDGKNCPIPVAQSIFLRQLQYVLRKKFPEIGFPVAPYLGVPNTINDACHQVQQVLPNVRDVTRHVVKKMLVSACLWYLQIILTTSGWAIIIDSLLEYQFPDRNRNTRSIKIYSEYGYRLKCFLTQNSDAKRCIYIVLDFLSTVFTMQDLTKLLVIHGNYPVYLLPSDEKTLVTGGFSEEKKEHVSEFERVMRVFVEDENINGSDRNFMLWVFSLYQYNDISLREGQNERVKTVQAFIVDLFINKL